MARKGNQQKNGLERHGLSHKKGVSGGVLPGMKDHAKGGTAMKVYPGKEIVNGEQQGCISPNASEVASAGDDNGNVQKSEKFSRKEKQGVVANHGMEEPVSSGSNSGDGSLNSEVPIQEENGTCLEVIMANRV